MPISSFSTDYSSRTVDINILKVKSYTSQTTQADTLAFGPVSQYVTGIQKLVQKYTILLLSNLGSQVNYPDFGTKFLPKLETSNITISRLDVQHIFNFANLIVTQVFTDYQHTLLEGQVPSDELFNSATMTNFSTSGRSLSLTILITSQAGNSTVFVLPIPLNS